MHKVVAEVKFLLNGKEIGHEDRSKITEVLIAEAVALRLELPSGAVEDPRQYYMTHHKVGVVSRLAKANEYQVIDVDRAAELVYKTWLMRYRLVHESNGIKAGRLLAHAISANATTIDPEHTRIVNSYRDVFLGRYFIDESEELANA